MPDKVEKVNFGQIGPPPNGVLPRPCFPKILARTTFVFESLPEAKNPGQDAIYGDFVVKSSNSCYTAYLIDFRL